MFMLLIKNMHIAVMYFDEFVMCFEFLFYIIGPFY